MYFKMKFEIGYNLFKNQKYYLKNCYDSADSSK